MSQSPPRGSDHTTFKMRKTQAQAAARRKKKDAFLLRKTRTHSVGPFRNHAMLRGLHAWGEISSMQEEQAIAKMSADGSPPANFSDSDAWWAMALTTDPVFLNEEARADCQMLMGFAPAQTPPPNWDAIAARACAIYDGRRKGARCDSELFLRPDDERHEFCSGRGFVFSPCFSMSPAFFEDPQSFSKIFDRRRALRRQGSAPPPDWERDFGPKALDLWLGGLSRRTGPPKPDASWIDALGSLMEAMAEAGAAHVQLYPGFFSIFPHAMDHFATMELIDREASDPLRSSWQIGECARPISQNDLARRRL